VDAIAEHLATSVSSTGLAGGNTLDEATCHALGETIERDATARFDALSPADREEREVDLGTVTGPARQLVQKLDAAGLLVRVWDQTSVVGVPAFGCTLDSVAELRGLARFSGYGAHLDPEVAISRAVSEAVQSRLTIISGARDDQTPATYAAMQVAGGGPVPPSNGRRSFGSAPQSQTTGAFASDARLLVSRLCAAGFHDVLRVDLTRSDVGIPVVFVFVPLAKMVLD
jgi:ribosomal protein S12 methylthiotransferase accessory factor